MNSIVIAVVIVAAIGLIAGLGLAKKLKSVSVFPVLTAVPAVIQAVTVMQVPLQRVKPKNVHFASPAVMTLQKP